MEARPEHSHTSKLRLMYFVWVNPKKKLFTEDVLSLVFEFVILI